MSELAESKMTNFFDQLFKNCDCPIKYHDHDVWRGKYDHSHHEWFEGQQCFDGEISISSLLPSEGKEGTLTHEIGHHRHHKHIGTDKYEATNLIAGEIIAELYALHLLLKNKRKEALKYRFSTYKEFWENSYEHAEALKVIKCRRIWKRCEQFLKEG